ncbi:uncharacterized [Tachysurus ichikawai]
MWINALKSPKQIRDQVGKIQLSFKKKDIQVDWSSSSIQTESKCKSNSIPQAEDMPVQQEEEEEEGEG